MMNVKTLSWIWGGCVGVLGCVLLAVAAFFLSGASKYIVSSDVEVENIAVQVSAPQTVKLHEKFVVEVKIANTADVSQELDSIDIYASYLDGMLSSGTKPEFMREREVGAGRGRYSSFDFKLSIPAGGTQSVLFFLTAMKTGSYSGDVYVCVNSPTLCNIYKVKTHVGE